MSNLTGNYKISIGEVQGVDSVREQERRARLQLLDDIREPSPQPIFGEPVKVDLEDETSRRIKNTLGDFTQVLINDPKNLIGISRSTSSSHPMNGHPSNGYIGSGHPVNGYSSIGHPSSGHSATGHPLAGYSSNGHMMSGHGVSMNPNVGHTSSSYSRTQTTFKKPSYIVNGASVPKPSMPNYISPKAPDKRQNYNRPDKPSYNHKPESPVAPKVNPPQSAYPNPESRPRDSSPWESKDKKRTNPLPITSAACFNLNVESNSTVSINNVNICNNSISTSAPIWNCGPDTPAIQITPFHIPANATPSVVSSKNVSNYGQNTSYSSTPTAAKYEPANSIPTKRNVLRPSSLKIQPERKSEAPIAVETILKEMTKAVPPAPLTAIQTPRTEETGFSFPADSKEETSFLKLDEQVHLITPLEDPTPTESSQSSPKPWWKSTETKLEAKNSRPDCKVADSSPYELSKEWKPAGIDQAKPIAASESAEGIATEPLRPIVTDPVDKALDLEPNKYVSSSLQDDLEMSDSDEEVIPEVINNLEQYLKSPVKDSTSDPINTQAVTANITNTMDANSAESSNSSSSESGDSDSDDSSSESNDSDSSSEASDEEISSKKWGLSNFVDESQRIHSPAFFQTDAAAKESFRLHAERIKNFGLGNVNPVNASSFVKDPFTSSTETATFLVPEVPGASKNTILSPIPSPVHPTVGPRTPPSPSCPLKSDSPVVTDAELVNTQIENKSAEISEAFIPSISQQSNEPQESCDITEDKGTVQNDKCKKQLRSVKAKSEEVISEIQSPVENLHVGKSNDLKESSETSMEKDNMPVAEKVTSRPMTPKDTETSTENYSIKTRQRVTAASSAKKSKSSVNNSSESTQNSDSASSLAIAKLKHPRACRKSNEKQNKKQVTTSASKKADTVVEPKKQPKQETKNLISSEKIKENQKSSGTVKSISKASVKPKVKILKTSPPKQAIEVKKPEIKKKKKKFAIENFLQSPENVTTKAPSSITPFTPSPDRSPIPGYKTTPLETAQPSVVVPNKIQKKSISKNKSVGKKVEKLRRSVRCSERASNNVQTELLTPQQEPESVRNLKNVDKGKRNVENLSSTLKPSVELLSPIPHDPPLSTSLIDSAIPLKIMVCIPLSKLAKIPLTLHQAEAATRQPVKNNSANDEIRMQKKDNAEKNMKNSDKRSQFKDFKDKVKTPSPLKNNKTNAKSTITTKKDKSTKPLVGNSAKSKTVCDTTKSSVKIKDKSLCDDTENKLPKKRKSESEEKPIIKKSKLSSRRTDERKLKESSSNLKTDLSTSQAGVTSKSKPLERCDSTGSLSSLCSQQSQRSSKSSKEKKKESSTGAPESKRIKTCSVPLLSIKDIKQEKEDRSKNSGIDVRIPVDKSKNKLREKPTTKEMIDHFWDEDKPSSLYWEEKCKEDPKFMGSSNQILPDPLNREIAVWDNFVPEMHKELKEGSTLKKHSNHAAIMPMDYYWTEAEKQKMLAEKEKNPFQQAVKCFEAGVLYILTSQQKEEYCKEPDSVYSYYIQTLKFFGVNIITKVKKLQSCPGSTEFKLLILCLKSQSLLNVKLYNLKIKEIKEQLDCVTDFLQHQCSTSTNTSHQSRVSNIPSAPSPHSSIPSPASSVNSISSNIPVSVSQGILDMICRQHTHLINLHKGHDLWEQADMYMTRSNLREFFKEVADQSEPLTLHSSITELVKYIQKGISLVKKSLH